MVADESTGRSLPFVFLERVKDDFKQRYGASIRSDASHPLADGDEEDDLLFEDRFSIAYNLDREFGFVSLSDIFIMSCELYCNFGLFRLTFCFSCFSSTGPGLKSTWSIA